MHMLRLPIKYIEKFRRFKAEPAESQNIHHTEAALIEMVMRRAGTDACREIRIAISDILKGREIETNLPKDRNCWDGKPYWVFTPNRVAIRSNQVAQLVRYRKCHPAAIYGIDVEKEYATPHGKVCIYGKVAALEGAEILDPRPIFEPVKTAKLIDWMPPAAKPTISTFLRCADIADSSLPPTTKTPSPTNYAILRHRAGRTTDCMRITSALWSPNATPFTPIPP